MSQIQDLLNTMEYGPAPEDAKLAHEWLNLHQRKFGFFIGGHWIEPVSTFPTFQPATGDELAQIGLATEGDVDRAVKAAEKGQRLWRQLSALERSKLMYALARQIQKHARLFAVLETLENGKPIRETRDIDIPLVARHFYYHAGWAMQVEERFPDHEPVGVCGQIIPWNFPLLMLSWKIAPALAAGNAVVLKPAEFTSLTALLFAEICEKVGLPRGVVNIVTGDGSTGKAIVEHPNINKIAFTGSTEVGRIIREATAGTGKKISLELGGKSPFIVFEDADLDSVVEGIVDAIWFNQGQVCCAGSRLLVQEGIAEKLYTKIRNRMQTLRVGNPLDKAIDVGAIIDSTQLARISGLVQQGVSEGAQLYQSPCDLPKAGWFYPPTLLTHVEPASTVAQVEIFGPVLVAMTFRTPSEAVALANNSVYGLASSIWTQNIDLAHEIAAQVQAGTVWINCTNQFDASVGFGGYRESGYGREGGPEGLLGYLQPKSGKNCTSLLKPVKLGAISGIDRTHKLFIGGKQARSDSGYSLEVATSAGLEEVSRGNRKDVRNAVEAAHSARAGWARATAFNRAQILFYLAENLENSSAILQQSLVSMGLAESAAAKEIEQSIQLVFAYASWADKHEGTTHQVPSKMLVYTRNEPIGVAGTLCGTGNGLVNFLAANLPLISMGNTVVSVADFQNPLPAVELYRIIEASDIPAGVWNILTGTAEEVVPTLLDHDGIDVVWNFNSEWTKETERRSIGNLKQTWCGPLPDVLSGPSPALEETLRKATQVKNVWVPYGI